MTDPAFIDGVPATAADLVPLAFSGFAHFTAMQVRGGGIRGLDLHLQRLRYASQALFGRSAPDEDVLALIAQAAARVPDASLTITMFSRSGEFARADDRTPVTLTRTAPPNDGPAGPLRLDLVRHERWRPDIKHVGEGAKTYLLNDALARGFDDAVFVDANRRVSEATIWNLAFWDGASVIWPDAAVLPGVTMGILRRQLTKAGVPQRDAPVRRDALEGLTGAVVMNSWTPAVAVSRIADLPFARSDVLARILHDAYAAEPWAVP